MPFDTYCFLEIFPLVSLSRKMSSIKIEIKYIWGGIDLKVEMQQWLWDFNIQTENKI